MAQQTNWAAGKPSVEDVLLAFEADTAAYSGHLQKARELSLQAAASAETAGEKETAAGYEAVAALRESLFGNSAESRRWATKALNLSRGRDAVSGGAGVGICWGYSSGAVPRRGLLGKRFPKDTVVLSSYLPIVRARLALIRKDSSKAIEILQTAHCDLCAAGGLEPFFVRGEAYLAAHQGPEATTDFQEILDQRGLVFNEPIGALANLELARAYAIQDESIKSRAAYGEFLTLWKDADPGIPILRAAKAEYAKLR
jgi:hypothetical protein